MYKQVLILRADLKMGKGKLVAQGAHASLHAFEKTPADVRKEWESHGSKKVVAKVASEQELLALYEAARGLPRALIRDAGLTQIPHGTVTAVGIGPAPEHVVDKITAHLKLL